jgi:signal transduction histidine kinase
MCPSFFCLASLEVSALRKVALPHHRPSVYSFGNCTGLFKQIVRNLPFGMAVLEIVNPRDWSTWQVLATNSVAARVAGTTVRALVNLPLTNRTRLKNSITLRDTCCAVLAHGRPKSIGQLNYTLPTGRREVYFVHVSPLADRCLSVVFQDMTLAQESIQKLLEKDWQIAQMCESARAIVWRADPVTLQFNYVTPQAQEILGYWMERWLHESDFLRNRLHADDWQVFRHACTKAFNSGVKQHFECRLFDVQGEARWFSVYVQKIHQPYGRGEIGGAMVDVTLQKMAALSAREVALAVMRAQEEERKSISRDLHDSIGQNLASLNFALWRLQQDPGVSKSMRAAIGECQQTVQACTKEIRSVSYMLHPPLLDLMGLGPALRSLGKKFSEQSGISLDVDVPRGSADLSSTAQIALFRVAQECLTNIQKHSGAKSAHVRLFKDPDAVHLEVEDHGRGIDPGLIDALETGVAGPGIGLLKMRERIKDLKGHLTIRSNGKGTLISIRIPRSGESAQGLEQCG